MTAELVCTIIGTAVIVGTIVHQNAKGSGKIEAWMKGHEQLDATRFTDIKEHVARIESTLNSKL